MTGGWLTALLGLAILILLAPRLLKALGLHPDYDGANIKLPGKKALIITTSQKTLDKPGKTGGKATGVFGSEMTVPYYEFLDAGMDVDLASIKGGEIPIEPNSFYYGIRTKADERYLKDPIFQTKVKQSLAISEVDVEQYDVVFLAGGWGAAYDLGTSEVLGKKISQAYYADKTPIIGAVCHGPLGLIRAKDKNGNLLIQGRRLTGVTNRQIKELGIGITPQHPETELRKANVKYENGSAFLHLFANHVVVDDEKRFVTGQNQNAGHEAAQKIMTLLSQRQEA